MTDTQLDWWAKAVKANLTIEAKVGEATKSGSIYDVKELGVWVKAHMEKSEEFDYWLVTVENDKLRRRSRSHFHEGDLLELAENCLTAFERGLGTP